MPRARLELQDMPSLARRRASLRQGMAVFVSLLALLAAWPGMAAETAASCAAKADDRQRLACYDSIFRQPAMAEPTPVQAEVTQSGGVMASTEEQAPSRLSKIWELEHQDKRGTFTVRTYLPNFLLPLHYTNHVNHHPGSPTHPASDDPNAYRSMDAKLQVSLRAKVAEDFLLPGADLWFAYTQRSLWQVWDRKDSAPFRSTDYQPEAIYVVPLSTAAGELPLGWNARMLQLGIAHQSNGQSDPQSRSWNRIYVGAGLERGEVALLAKVNHRLNERGKDDNPDLTDHIGHGEVTMLWSPGPATASLTWRTSLDALHHGSLQLDWTHPVFSDEPTGLRWHAQLFSGYGETLLDYNHRQTSLGLGLSLFQF